MWQYVYSFKPVYNDNHRGQPFVAVVGSKSLFRGSYMLHKLKFWPQNCGRCKKRSLFGGGQVWLYLKYLHFLIRTKYRCLTLIVDVFGPWYGSHWRILLRKSKNGLTSWINKKLRGLLTFMANIRLNKNFRVSGFGFS